MWVYYSRKLAVNYNKIKDNNGYWYLQMIAFMACHVCSLADLDPYTGVSLDLEAQVSALWPLLLYYHRTLVPAKLLSGVYKNTVKGQCNCRSVASKKRIEFV